MNNYVATFYTHYGAMKFTKICKSVEIEARLMPVPRRLSSSCGTCVFFAAPAHDFVFDNAVVEDLENCYRLERDEYIKLQP